MSPISLLNTKPKKIIALILFVLLVAGIGLLVYSSRSTGVSMTQFDDEQNQELLDAEPIEKVLVFSFSVTEGDSPFSLDGINEYNAKSQQVGKTTGSFTMGIIEDDQPVYSHSFSLPQINIENFDDDGTITSEGVITGSHHEITTPRFKDGSTYFIRNSQGEIVLEGRIVGVGIHDNEPDYKSTIGE